MIYPPLKLIHNFKNNYGRTQYMIYIFIGEVNEDILKILNRFNKLSFDKTLELLSNKDLKTLEKEYGSEWYKSFFFSKHLSSQIKKINNNKTFLNKLKSKFSEEWINSHIIKFKSQKKDILFSFETKYVQDLKKKKIDLGIKKEMDFRTHHITQKGGNDDNLETVDAETIDGFSDNEEDEIIDFEEIETSDDEINLTNLEQINQNVEIKEEQKEASKTADLLAKALNEKNWEKKELKEKLDYNNKLDENTFDMDLEDIFLKEYITNTFIYPDDNIKTIKSKITYAIPLNPKFGNDMAILPSRMYLYSSYFINKNEEQVMIGQKWVRRNELLKIDVIPNPNLKMYENLRGNLRYLRDSFGVKMKRDDDEDLILRDYEDFITMNELFMTDVYSSLGLDYNPPPQELKNMYDVYISIYYPFLTYQNLSNIIEFLNKTEKKDQEVNFIQVQNKVIRNDIKLESEITSLIFDTKKNELEKINQNFSDNYILHSIIHVNMASPDNVTGTILEDKFNLYAIFDSFIVNDEYPFIQFNSLESGLTYKFYQEANIINKPEVMSKWFENAPYGLSIKKEYESGNYISFNINELGRIEYKITWREDDKTTIQVIKKTYEQVRELIFKINNETNKVKMINPEDERFTYAFVNTIQKFKIPGNKKISHNDLSDFARYFFPFISLVIDPRKRESKIKKKEETSKFGTYLRYKRISRYENRIRMHMRILYFIRNFEFTDRDLIDEIAKQFNITLQDSAKKLDIVREKYGNVIKKSRKTLKKLKNLPKSKPPGIGIDIQGRDPDNYKIRITGARNKNQLIEIVDFIKILIHLYTQTYLEKKPKYQKIKDKLRLLNNIAKRRNKVRELVNYENEINNVKALIAMDKNRLGYKPSEGESQYTRLCQNSGEDKKRQPAIVSSNNLKELLKKGFKYDEKTKMYLKEHQDKNDKILLRAIPLGTDEGKTNYFYCDPDVNKQHKYIGFLVRGNNPDGLCLPCCFKKDQYVGDNEVKKNYFKKCIGEVKDYQVEKKSLQDIGDKLYILQETNKVQEGRFLFLPKYLDVFFNKLWDRNIKIKNHYMTESSTGYFLKFTVKDKKFHFLASVSAVIDLTFDEIIEKVVQFFNKKENRKYFYFLNNGDISNRFNNLENYLAFIESKKYLDYEVLGEALSLPNVIYPEGINFFIFNKKKTFDSDNKEKISYNLDCLNEENQKFILKQDKNNIFLIKEGKYFFPILNALKEKNDKKIIISKKYDYQEINDNMVNQLRNLYQTSCNETVLSIISISARYYAKKVIEDLKNYKLINQHLDSNGKVRYLTYQDFVIPVYPGGLDYNYPYTFDDIKMYSLKDIIKQNKQLDSSYSLDKILFSDKSKDTYNVIGVRFKNKLILPIKSEKIKEKELKKLRLTLERKPLEKEIDNKIKQNKIIVDDKKLIINEEKYLDEGYNMFRFELSNYLNKYSKQVIDIVRSQLDDKEKTKKLRNLLISLINPKLSKLLKGGSVKKQVHMMVSLKKPKDLSNFKVKNTRVYCLVNKNQNKCDAQPFCAWSENRCYFSMEDTVTLEYINRVIQEMIQDSLRFKEIIQEDSYYVSDIVNTKDFTQRDKQKILKADNLSLGKIMNKIFGEDALPEIGKRSFSKLKIDMENQPELEQIGKQYSQEIVSNKDSIIRAFANGLYWLKNPLYSNNRRNLGYHSMIQNKLTQLLKAKIIDYVVNASENEKILNQANKYKEIKDYFVNSSDLNSKLLSFAKNKNNGKGIFELFILNQLFNIPIVVFDKYNDFYLGFDKEIIKDKNKIEKLSKESNVIKLRFDVTEEIKTPRKVYSIY